MHLGRPCTGPKPGKCIVCAARHYGALKGPEIAIANFATRNWVRSAVDMYLPVSHAVADAVGLPRLGLPYDVVPNFTRALPNSPPTAEAAHLLSQLPDGEFLLYVGDVSHEKGVDVLLRVHRSLPNPPPLVTIGRQLLPRANGGRAHVLSFDLWPHAAVLQAMRRSMMVIVPSVWPEPFGLVALEAMAAGRPVIASGTGGLVDVVSDGETGFLLPPGNEQSLRNAICRLHDDPALRERMGAAAIARAATFSADEIVPRVERIYESARVQALDPVGTHG
jgi:glycosyltransferase involved in cell wall biosynthesis